MISSVFGSLESSRMGLPPTSPRDRFPCCATASIRTRSLDRATHGSLTAERSPANLPKLCERRVFVGERESIDAPAAVQTSRA